MIFTRQCKGTLNACCTRIAQIKRLKLTTGHGNLDALIAKGADGEEYLKMDKVKEDAVKFTFLEPSALEVGSRCRPLVQGSSAALVAGDIPQ